MTISVKFIITAGWLFWFSLSNQLYAQVKKGILKEELHESTLNATGEFQPSYKNEYAYDSQQRLIYKAYLTWDNDIKEWKKGNEYFHGYDQWGNMSYFKQIDYNNLTDSIYSIQEIKYTYQDSLILSVFENHIIYNMLETNKIFIIETQTSYTYTADGMKIMKVNKEGSFIDGAEKEVEIKTYCYNTSGTLSYRSEVKEYKNHYNYDSTFYYRNKNNCLLGLIRYKSTEPYRFLHRYDSSLLIYTNNICKPDTAMWFGLEPDSNHGSLSLRRMIINVLDSRGRVMEEFNYGIVSDSILFLHHKVGFQYDQFDREILRVDTSFDSNWSLESIKEYDVQDNVIYYRERSSDSTKSEWTNENEVIQQFDEKNRRIYYLYKFNWNNETQQYEGYSSEQNIYNHHDLLVEKESNFFGKTIYGYHLEQNYQMTYEDRCDGFYRSGYAVSNRTESGEDYVESRNYELRITYSYYDIGICEDLVAEQNKIILFPNPANEYLHIRSTEILEDAEFRLVNSMGQILLTKPLPDGNYFSLNLYGLHSGIYIIQVSGQDKEYSERFVLSK